ncbi:MAG: DUF1549 domain-containing protein, partial [Verrucomicrobiota bacterium]
MLNLGKWVRPGVIACAIFCGSVLGRSEVASPEAGNEFFESKIRPLLAEHCYKCHSAQSEKLKGELLLDTREGLLKGGTDGVVIVPGDPEKSRLIESVRYQNKDLQMPPKKPLTDAQVADLVAWVKMGAPDPRVSKNPVVATNSRYDFAAARRQWGFRAPDDPPPPPVKNSAWAKSPIDHFILAKLEEKGLRPASRADKRTLIRRATFDLTGLPPTVSDIDAFLADESATAFEKVVNRLLASPQYGEHWGRHWLDQVRYADSVDKRQIGQPGDINEAWRYRDWVVNAFNDDLPYDQFVLDQFAGDLVPGPGKDKFNSDGIVATSMLAIGRWEQGEADKEKMMTDIVDDQIDVTGRTFLGLTLACARCHDHKFDPIPTRDYYSLAGIFYSSHVIPEVGSKGGDTARLRVPLDSPAELEARAKREERKVELQKQIEQTTDEQISFESRKILQASANYLRGVVEYKNLRATNASLTVTEFAKKFRADGVDAPLLAHLVEYLSWSEPKLLPKLVSGYLGESGVYVWHNAQDTDTPSVTINTNEKELTPGGIKLPAHSIVLHPSAGAGVAVAWKSPLNGKIRVVGRVADANGGCGDGIEWTLEKTGLGRTRISSGAIPNGGEQKFSEGKGGEQTGSIEIQSGEFLQVSILPKANHGCDSTIVELEITSIEDGTKNWNLAKDAGVNLPKSGNPQGDLFGHAGVWHYFDLVDQQGLGPEIPADSILARWRGQLDSAKTISSVEMIENKIQESLLAA